MTQNTQAQPKSSRAVETRAGNALRRWMVVAGLSLLIGVIVFAADRRGFLSSFNLGAYDFLVSLQHSVPPSDLIFNVDFDEASVRRYDAFPLPRLLLAEVIAKIASGKPAVMGLDVILDLPRVEGDDRHLAKVIDDAGNVILISEYGFGAHELKLPLPIFQKAAAGVAFADLPIDEDGAVRRMFLRITTNKYKAFSLPVALADIASDQHLRPGGRGFLLFGSRRLPLATTSPGPDTAWIHFRPAAPTRIVSVESLLSPGFDASLFAGKIVLVGQSSEMAKDLFSTPVTRANDELVEILQDQSRVTIAGRHLLSGAEIHGAAVRSLLTGNLVRTLHSFPRIVTGLVLGFSVIALGLRNRWYIALAACLLLALCTFFAALLLFSRYHIWMPFVSMETCLFAALPAGLGYRSVEERRLKNQMEAERHQLMGLFERYVSADVAAEIWKNRDAIVLAGEQRVATILFSDIRSFTAMTTGIPSQEVLAWLNRYLTAMGEVIKKNRGFLNKFIGDGIMVVFGAPLSEGPAGDACRAVRCALDMLARVDQWNATKAPGDPLLKIGIGIHTGQVTAGNVGSPDRLEYSVIGETVNLASRLEALTKEFKNPLVLSPATWEHVRGQFFTVSLGDAQVRGFASSMPLYSVESSTAIEVHS
jgi:adenylate cyclase